MKCCKIVKFIGWKRCWKGCLDLMFYHTKIEVFNDLESFYEHVKSLDVNPMELGGVKDQHMHSMLWRGCWSSKIKQILYSDHIGIARC